MVKVKASKKKLGSKKKLKNATEKVKKKTSKKKSGEKLKNEKSICPKLRLEPRLLPIKGPSEIKTIKVNDLKSPKKIAPSLAVKNNSHPFSDLNFESVKLPETITFLETEESDSDYDAADADVSYRAVRHKINHLKYSTVYKSIALSSGQRPCFRPRLKKKLGKGRLWKDSELLRLATALQKYGFKDTKKIADYVKTKNENQVKDYIKYRSSDVQAAEGKLGAGAKTEKDPDDLEMNNSTKSKKGLTRQKQLYRGRPQNKWTNVSPDQLLHWPSIRKWRRLAFDQMLACSRSKDYSKTVITDLLESFCKEEEPSDPQAINVKAIYQYLLESVSDVIPGQLPPKESALMLDLLKDLKMLPMVHNFDEETKFLENFTEATQYWPFEVKDEFKKRFIKKEDSIRPSAVRVPEEIFANLSCHKRVVQSFNPLAVPVWMMQKEQEYMEQST